jgi:hypothetical protein
MWLPSHMSRCVSSYRSDNLLASFEAVKPDLGINKHPARLLGEQVFELERLTPELETSLRTSPLQMPSSPTIASAKALNILSSTSIHPQERHSIRGPQNSRRGFLRRWILRPSSLLNLQRTTSVPTPLKDPSSLIRNLYLGIRPHTPDHDYISRQL